MATLAAAPTLRRALLYVPASSAKMLTKSLTLTADNITYDLEDSVTPHEKPNARQALANHLASLARPSAIGEIAARINAVSTPYAEDDLRVLGSLPGLDALVIPKVNSAHDLAFVMDVLDQVRGNTSSAAARAPPPTEKKKPLKLIALIESAQSILNLAYICSVGRTQCSSINYPLVGLVFAAEDFALDLSLSRTPSLKEFLYARSAIATHARAFNVPSTIDLVCTTFRGQEGAQRLQEECLDGKGMGFNGKQCIHPSQVETVQRLFAPAEDEVEWSVRIVIADEKAASGGGGKEGRVGRGAWTLDGKMIDAPVVGKAKVTVEKARLCGFDIESMREKWKHQEPA